jgi:hypothetical protein
MDSIEATHLFYFMGRGFLCRCKIDIKLLCRCRYYSSAAYSTLKWSCRIFAIRNFSGSNSYFCRLIKINAKEK